MLDILVFSCFVIFSGLNFGLKYKTFKSKEDESTVQSTNFKSFQKIYFGAYFCGIFADWLQGPFVYKLYEFYGFQEFHIALLYLTGFFSSILFGTITGPIADKFGRKKMVLIFCLFYSICCLTKLSSSFYVLLIGRLFGGVSTSILFSSFESWYVFEHKKRGFKPAWMSHTFSFAVFCNGLLAIISGVACSLIAEVYGLGPQSPFITALFPLLICGGIVWFTWNENYGPMDKSESNLLSSASEGLKHILKNPLILHLGIIQSVVESIMYIFVFLWTPILSPSNPPLGMVFGCYMICIMIGTSIFNILSERNFSHECILKIVLHCLGSSVVCVLAGLSIKSKIIGLPMLFFSFCSLEVCFGIYFPTISILKSQAIPESHRATIMNWFRVPLNVITCCVLLSLKISWISNDKRIIFLFCLCLIFLGLLSTIKLCKLASKDKKT